MSAERATNPFETHLDRTAANFTPLTPLTFIERAAVVYRDHPSVIDGERRFTWAETYARCRRLAAALDRRGVVAAGAVAGRHAGDVDDVLYRDRNPVQRTAVPARRELPVEGVGVGAGLLARDVDEGVEACVESPDALQAHVGQLTAGDGTRAQQCAEPFDLCEGHFVGVHGHARSGHRGIDSTGIGIRVRSGR